MVYHNGATTSLEPSYRPSGEAPFVIDGFAIERVRPNDARYRLVAVFKFGSELEIGRRDNQASARALESKVARNSAIIKAIELRDGSTVLETVWPAPAA